MNEEKPKSIWKKPWKGPRAVFLQITLFSAAGWLIIFFAIILMSSLNAPGTKISFALFVITGVCMIISGLFFLFYPLIRWIFHWRNFKKFLFGLACFITLIALFYAEEDWRGKHDWNKFKRQWEAKGERFDWQSIVPPPVPDDENFAFSPVWIAEEFYEFQRVPERAKAWYGDRIYSDEVSKIFPLMDVSVSGLTGTNSLPKHLPNTPDEPSGWSSGQMTDLKPWQNYYREVEKVFPAAGIPVAPQPQTPAQDVLLALSKFDPVIEQLRRDSAKPYSRFPLQYDGMPAAILLPHLAAEKRIAQVLQLRAVAELQNGENEKAFADIKLMMRLVEASRTEPFLICHLVRIAIFNYALQPIWVGLANHQWSDAQLTELDAELAKLDFVTNCKSVFRSERNCAIANIEYIRQHARDPRPNRPRFYSLAPLLFSFDMMFSDFSDNENTMNRGFSMLAVGLGPSGWIEQNELRLAQFNLKWYLPVADEKAKTISPDKARAADDALVEEIQRRTPENILETLLIPRLSGAMKNFAYTQSSTDLARVALALERYRLANGNYPESLDALAPKFISKMPHDVIGGQPLKYRRDSANQFVLYSVGWNERDDGGVVVFKKGSSPSVDIGEGDWVWKYPQNKP